MSDDRRALVERLFTAHRNALLAFFHRRAPLWADAADLAQEVYVRMMRVRNTEEIRNPEAYLFTVASNLAKERRALHRRRGTTIDVEDATVQSELADLPAFGEQIDAERRLRRLDEVLRQLPPKGQAAIVLKYVHGLSYDEIGERLGVSPRMVKKYLVQSLAHCRLRMRRLG